MDFADFTGPMGGVIAAAFGFGWVAGYGFATKTLLAVANDRISELQDKLEKAEERIQALEDQRFELAREKG